MPIRSDDHASAVEPSGLSVVLWRLAAGTAFALSLLGIKFGLLGAVFLLLTAIFCLPGARASLGKKAGVRMPGTLNAAGATLLALLGMISMGMNVQLQQRGAVALDLLAKGTRGPLAGMAEKGMLRRVAHDEPPTGGRPGNEQKVSATEPSR
jgi:hypothetical protein